MLIKLQYFWTTIIDFLKNWNSCAKSHLNESGFKIIALPNTFYKVIGSHRAIFLSRLTRWHDTSMHAKCSDPTIERNKFIGLFIFHFSQEGN